jgi:hypothetical protein
MGVALESHRLDQVRQCIARAPFEGEAKASLLSYTLDLCVGQQQLLHSRVFREQVLQILVEVHSSMSDENRDYAAEIQCLQHLDNAPAAAEVLKTLLRGTFKIIQCPFLKTVSLPVLILSFHNYYFL